VERGTQHLVTNVDCERKVARLHLCRKRVAIAPRADATDNARAHRERLRRIVAHQAVGERKRHCDISGTEAAMTSTASSVRASAGLRCTSAGRTGALVFSSTTRNE
jgi:hypothetical protein